MSNRPSKQVISEYDFNEHRHRFALWTVARAQRAFAKNQQIAHALNRTDLRYFVENTKRITQDDFDEQHKLWCNSIIIYFGDDKCFYGRAAKM